MSRSLALLALLPLLVLAACHSGGTATLDGGPEGGEGGAGGGPNPCDAGFLGDRDGAPELTMIALGADGGVAPLQDGDTVALVFPPQGGRVIFAGARATNLDACAVQITGALRDETTKQVRVDARTVNLLRSGDGWGESDPTDISSFANVAVCPNEWSKTNIYGTEYQLSLSVTDAEGRTASVTLEVTPACAQPENAAECMCICMGGYVLGQSCADAGAGDAGAGDAGDGGE